MAGALPGISKKVMCPSQDFHEGLLAAQGFPFGCIIANGPAFQECPGKGRGLLMTSLKVPCPS